MAGLQFTDKTDVIEGYQRARIPAWGIWCGRSLCFSYSGDNVSEGAADLTETLDMLDRAGMAANYQLAMYDAEDIANQKTSAGRITSKTPYISSFNFRLSDTGSGVLAGTRLLGTGEMTIKQYIESRDTNKILLDELKALRMEVNELKEGSGEPDDDIDEYGLGKIGRVLQHPVIGPMATQLVGALTQLLQRGLPAGQVAGIPVTASADPYPLDDQAKEALKVLYAAVPDFSVVLDKLKDMALRQPATLSTYVNVLKSMVI